MFCQCLSTFLQVQIWKYIPTQIQPDQNFALSNWSWNLQAFTIISNVSSDVSLSYLNMRISIHLTDNVSQNVCASEVSLTWVTRVFLRTAAGVPSVCHLLYVNFFSGQQGSTVAFVLGIFIGRMGSVPPHTTRFLGHCVYWRQKKRQGLYSKKNHYKYLVIYVHFVNPEHARLQDWTSLTQPLILSLYTRFGYELWLLVLFDGVITTAALAMGLARSHHMTLVRF